MRVSPFLQTFSTPQIEANTEKIIQLLVVAPEPGSF